MEQLGFSLTGTSVKHNPYPLHTEDVAREWERPVPGGRLILIELERWHKGNSSISLSTCFVPDPPIDTRRVVSVGQDGKISINNVVLT